MFPGSSQRWAGLDVIVLCGLMKKDVPVGTGVVVCVMKRSPPVTQQSRQAQGLVGESG